MCVRVGVRPDHTRARGAHWGLHNRIGAAHARAACGPREDIESLAYLLVMLLGGALPWASAGSMEELVATKTATRLPALVAGLPPAAAAFVRAALGLEDPTRVDYAALSGLLAPMLPHARAFAWAAAAGAGGAPHGAPPPLLVLLLQLPYARVRQSCARARAGGASLVRVVAAARGARRACLDLCAWHRRRCAPQGSTVSGRSKGARGRRARWRRRGWRGRRRGGRCARASGAAPRRRRRRHVARGARVGIAAVEAEAAVAHAGAVDGAEVAAPLGRRPRERVGFAARAVRRFRAGLGVLSSSSRGGVAVG